MWLGPQKKITRTHARKIKCPQVKLHLDPRPKISTVVTLDFYVTISAIDFKFDWPKCAGRAGQESKKKRTHF